MVLHHRCQIQHPRTEYYSGKVRIIVLRGFITSFFLFDRNRIIDQLMGRIEEMEVEIRQIKAEVKLFLKKDFF